MEYVWKCRDCKTEYPTDKEDLPKYINPSGIEGVICPCGGMLDLCPTQDAPDGAKAAATLSGLYNCGCCGLEKCSQPGICDDCLAPPTEFEREHWGDDDPAPLVI